MNIKNKLKTVLLSDIKPYKNNAKIHSEAQIKLLKESIEKHDYYSPIGIDEKNEIVFGHGRFEALKLIDPNQKIEVIDMSYLPAKEIKKLRILDNKIVSNEYDNEILKYEIEKLYKNTNESINEIINELNIDSKEIDKILGNRNTEGDDDIPDESNVVTKLGDIWELGRHKVLCGDSTIEDNYIKLLGDTKIDMVYTDPPYGVDYSGKNTFLNSIDNGNRIQKDIKNDSMDIEDTSEFMYKLFCKIKKILKDKSSYYFTSPQGADLMMMMMMMMEKAEIPLRHCLIWVKNNHVLGRCDYNYKHEPILYGWVNTHNFYGNGEYKTSTWEINKPHKSDLHPTMKPIELIENAILNSTLSNELVADLCLGSGSTLIACEKTNRICYGMELEPYYCDIIRDRYINYCKKNNINYSVKLNGKVWAEN